MRATAGAGATTSSSFVAQTSTGQPLRPRYEHPGIRHVLTGHLGASGCLVPPSLLFCSLMGSLPCTSCPQQSRVHAQQQLSPIPQGSAQLPVNSLNDDHQGRHGVEAAQYLLVQVGGGDSERTPSSCRPTRLPFAAVCLMLCSCRPWRRV